MNALTWGDVEREGTRIDRVPAGGDFLVFQASDDFNLTPFLGSVIYHNQGSTIVSTSRGDYRVHWANETKVIDLARIPHALASQVTSVIKELKTEKDIAK